jgi:hypothetical protein
MSLKKIFILILIVLVCLTLAVLSFIGGAATSALFFSNSANEVLEILALAGTWVGSFGSWLAGFATLLAVCAALYIAKSQADEQRKLESDRRAHEKREGTYKTLKYTMVLTESLIARVAYQKTALTDGRHWNVLSINASAIEARYEAFFDFELYEHFDSILIDKFKQLEGSFFGMNVVFKNSTMQGELSDPQKTDFTEALTQLGDDLKEFQDELYKAWSNVAKP